MATALVAEDDRAGGAAPGELVQLTASHLTAGGVPATLRTPESIMIAPKLRPRSRRRARRLRGAEISVGVRDDGEATADFAPWTAPDPHWVADIAAAFLTGTAGAGPRCPSPSRVGGFKGIAGSDLRHRGFKAEPSAWVSRDSFEVVADVEVTPGVNLDVIDFCGADTGTVTISDNGMFLWERCFCPGLPDVDAVARAIAGAVAAGVFTAWPELQARPAR